METQPAVECSQDDAVAVLHIAHPPANTLSLDTLDQLAAAVVKAIGAAGTRAIVITGKGRFFCAGADIRELADLIDRKQGEQFSKRGQDLCNTIENSPKPVIAAINGRAAMGGGVELALACHLRIIEESTVLSSPEVKLGAMVGWGASQRLPRLIGLGNAMHMLLTGRQVDAQEAFRMGLVGKVVPDGTSLQEAITLAKLLAEQSSAALAHTLEAVRAGFHGDLAHGLSVEASLFGKLCESRDWREGTAAFLERRAPRFGQQ